MEKIERHVSHVINYTLYNKVLRIMFKYHPIIHFISDIHEKNSIYTLKYKDKEYKFTFLSDEDIRKIDKKILYKINKRNEVALIRTLNLACKQYPNDKVIVAKTSVDELVCLIESKDKIIDYSKNIIMDKEQYYELFKVEELNKLDKYDIYLIYSVISDFEAYDLVIKFLLFNKEMIKDIGKNFEYLKLFTKDGINSRNLSVFGNRSDVIFTTDLDSIGWKYNTARFLIADFTMNATKKSIFFKKIKDQKYMLVLPNLIVKFRILSDYINDIDIKNELHSTNRYGKCHENSVGVANVFKKFSKELKEALVVSGTQQVNDKYSTNHSWVELVYEDYVLVVDYNMNLIMNKDDYYKIFGITVIEKTEIEELNKINNNLESIGLDLHNLTTNYFGKELNKDAIKVLKMFNEKK